MASQQISQKGIRNQVQIVALINLIIFAIVCIFEIVSIFVDLPLLFISEGDAAGIAEFSGNWLDHLLKSGIGLVMILIFIQALKNLKIPGMSRKKAYAFIIGASLIGFGIAIIHLLNYGASILNLIFEGAMEEFVWYQNLRLEMLLIPTNFAILKIWADKNRFAMVISDLN